MLGLFLTTTSLPPPVWTHMSSCLFKLHRFAVDCSSHRSSSVLFPFFPVAGCYCQVSFFPFRLQMSFWSDLLLVLCLIIVHNRFMCQFCFYIRRALVLFSLGNLFPYLSYLFLVRFIASVLLIYHLFIEHLFYETYYICTTLNNSVVFFFLIILFRFICLAIHIMLSSVAAFFC